ncbi:MAG: recombination protein RecR [Clostridia bacterium]|nr:recombination protein RecR [Clostridia bacterium]
MSYEVPALSKLIEHFERMPGIGRKTAQRMAFYVLSLPQEQSNEFSQAILEACKKIHRCKICQNITDCDVCTVCTDKSRDESVICVVEDATTMLAIEKTHEFNGLYHVLHGVISPIDSIGPEQLTIKELLYRLNGENVKEIIMATNPTVEGEMTAVYISKLLKPLGIKITRLAYGVPVGGELEYADSATLSRALFGRNEI